MPVLQTPPTAAATFPPSSEKRWHAGTLTYSTAGLVVLFTWLLWGDFAWSVKERSVPYIVQLLLKKYQASDMVAGLLIGSLPGILTMILCPIISWKSDRHRGKWGRRIPFLLIPTPIAVLAMAGLAFSPQIGKALHTVMGANSYGMNSSILISFGFFWMCFEFATITANTVFGGLVNDVVPQAVIGRFYGMFRALSLIAGMIFNFWLLGKAEVHFTAIFLGICALYGVGFTVMCLKVKEGEYEAPPVVDLGTSAPLGFLRAALQYFKECFGNSYFLWFFGTMAVSWMAFMPINLFSVFFAKSINMDMDVYGKCLAITFLGSLMLSYPLGALADRFHPLRVGLVAQMLYFTVALLGGFFIKDTWTFSVFFIAHGVLSGTWMTVIASIGQRILPREKFAQLGSAAGLVGGLCSIGVGPAMGVFLDRTHHIYRYTFIASAALTGLAFLAGLVFYRKFAALGGPHNYVPPEI